LSVRHSACRVGSSSRHTTLVAYIVAEKNKCLARNNKSRMGAEATKTRTTADSTMDAPSHDASGSQGNRAHLGLTLRKVRSGKYRVNFRDGNETTAYYADDLEEALKTAVEWPEIEHCELRRAQDRTATALRIRPKINGGSSSQKAAVVRICLGVFPVQRLQACVKALTSLNPSSHAILDTRSLGSSRYRTAKSRLRC
jgi:hypothetical protein